MKVMTTTRVRGRDDSVPIGTGIVHPFKKKGGNFPTMLIW